MEDDSHLVKAIYYLKRFIQHLFRDKKTSMFCFFLCHFYIGTLDFEIRLIYSFLLKQPHLVHVPLMNF